MMFSRAAVAGNTLGELALNAGNFVDEMECAGIVSFDARSYLSARYAMDGAVWTNANAVATQVRRRQFATQVLISMIGLTAVTRRAQFVAQSVAQVEAVAFPQVRPDLTAAAFADVHWDMRLDYRFLQPTDRERRRHIQPRKVHVVSREDRRVVVNRERRVVQVPRDRETV